MLCQDFIVGTAFLIHKSEMLTLPKSLLCLLSVIQQSGEMLASILFLTTSVTGVRCIILNCIDLVQLHTETFIA